MFYLIGLFYHESSTRVVYYFSGVSESAVFFMACFAFNLLGNRRLPPFISFFSELNILGVIFNFNRALMLVLGIYFIVAFYYGIYMLCHLMSGRSPVVVSVHSAVVVGLLMGLNVALIGVSF